MIVSCGIDFGTSNSAVAAGIDGDTAMIDLEHGQPTIPSAIFFDAEKGRISYGRDALRNYVEGTEGRLMRALKSILGSSLVDETTFVEGRPLSYKDVIARFMNHLKSVSETDLNEALTHAVIGSRSSSLTTIRSAIAPLSRRWKTARAALASATLSSSKVVHEVKDIAHFYVSLIGRCRKLHITRLSPFSAATRYASAMVG